MLSVDNYENLKMIGGGDHADIYICGDKAYKIFNNESYLKNHVSKDLIGKKSNLIVYPEELIQDNRTGTIIGYITPYIQSQTLEDVIYNTSFENLKEIYSEVEKQIREDSKNGLVVNDLTEKNIIWDEKNLKCRIIDTDEFTFDSEKDHTEGNVKELTTAFIGALGRDIIRFTRDNNDLYHYMYSDGKYKIIYNSFNEYLDKLKEEVEKATGRKMTELTQMKKEVELINKEFDEQRDEDNKYEEILEDKPLKLRLMKFFLNRPKLAKALFLKKLLKKQVKKLGNAELRYVNKEMYRTAKEAKHEKNVEKIYDKNSMIEDAIKENKQWDKEHNQKNILKQKAKDEARYTSIARDFGEEVADGIAEKEYRQRKKKGENSEEID